MVRLLQTTSGKPLNVNRRISQTYKVDDVPSNLSEKKWSSMFIPTAGRLAVDEDEHPYVQDGLIEILRQSLKHTYPNEVVMRFVKDIWQYGTEERNDQTEEKKSTFGIT